MDYIAFCFLFQYNNRSYFYFNKKRIQNETLYQKKCIYFSLLFYAPCLYAS
ncbi:hypothetical protein HCCG_01968 [Helicobacter cinaedi CCUG 18818 = ATCC BAA-847]|uniref:Uncharacterized protein n=1 Tax=Helicobacter cinaedi CCUG 18818 = ATCC BAA-847 TaxID=537971 RepID=A0ABN0BE51_9HELI|nr:hypothetical protein HCCG_01968 [Helicobacter cinaedi CCUG 18818 = ATCC BAA-847]